MIMLHKYITINNTIYITYITKNMYYVCYKNYFKVIVNNMGRYLGSVVNWKSKL